MGARGSENVVRAKQGLPPASHTVGIGFGDSITKHERGEARGGARCIIDGVGRALFGCGVGGGDGAGRWDWANRGCAEDGRVGGTDGRVLDGTDGRALDGIE